MVIINNYVCYDDDCEVNEKIETTIIIKSEA